ncbi:polysaccharide deacetylase family protein [Paenibacillus sp. UNC499MF]|uniref:polysaccharide deacetylase family protein n=1 Tax=Paenibacillus sp. UNC499MF TaxID=1502751 RepID=UPI0008A06945|nr:polysaccharide deacetylase family protein [Paenibacillus sp. UNC499MF]SEG55483.1 Peptidoglycan/xylan/chitin deacetylase, PgdA/CDA1 family [Paenibacillus sp. UNC499MF]
MVEGIIWMVFIFYLIYTLVPTFLIRRLGYGVFKSRSGSPCAALTFDDGPDPQYTPQLLDLLARKGTRATFFVLGAKAEHYPDLIRRMHEEGHLVGLHNYMHHSNALMTPWKVRRTLEHSADVIERITGIRPVHYRPPWGVFNVFDFLLIRKFRIVLWSMAAFDWRSRGGTDKIKRKLIGKVKDGAVILLHDSGDTLGANPDAPGYMIEALADVLEDARRRGIRFARIDEHLPGRRLPDRLVRRRAEKMTVVPAVISQHAQTVQEAAVTVRHPTAAGQAGATVQHAQTAEEAAVTVQHPTAAIQAAATVQYAQIAQEASASAQHPQGADQGAVAEQGPAAANSPQAAAEAANAPLPRPAQEAAAAHEAPNNPPSPTPERRGPALRAWMLWERLFHRLYRVQPGDPEHRFLHYRIRTYHGQELALDDGEIIRPGDKVAELHLDNEWLRQAGSQSSSMMKLAVQMIRAMGYSMPRLAHRLLTDPALADLKGVYGISMIHRGTKQFGFTVLPLHNRLWRWTSTMYLRILLGMLHPGGFGRLQENKDRLTPRIIAMSVQQMKRRYAPGLGAAEPASGAYYPEEAYGGVLQELPEGMAGKRG